MREADLAGSIDGEYERAYAEHWRDVFRFALAWTNDRAAAEDLAQESFLKLWRHRSAFDWQKPVLSWLLVTARNLATDRYRRLRRRFLGAPPRSNGEETWDRWLDVRDAMSKLSPLERSALILIALEGYSSGEAAEVLGTSPGALRSAVSRARDKLEQA